MNRKDRRKAERATKKSQKIQNARNIRKSNVRLNGDRESGDEGDDSGNDWSEEEPAGPSPACNVQKPTKGILKKLMQLTSIQSTPPDELSPSPMKVSRAVKDRLAQDDAEIAALEKKLGIKRKKKTKDSRDGLGDIFDDLGSFDSDEDFIGNSSKRKRGQDDEWLAKKRQKALDETAKFTLETVQNLSGIGLDDSTVVEDFGTGEDAIEEEEDTEDDEDMADCRQQSSEESVQDDEDVESDFEGPESDGSTEAEAPRPRENPYIAPVAPGTVSAGKYIPPALRAPPSSDTEALARLRRQIQGLLNRLSDANMMSILKDIEHVYQTNPRGYVTTTLVDLFIVLLADETTLPDTFLILHAGFIGAVYKVVGPDFGAQMIERIVSEFDRNYESNKQGSGKQTTNLMSVIAELYCFHVIGSNLVFDYIKMFLHELSEINTELLLRIVRVAGSQLRQDDPTSLKDIVLLLQKSVVNVGQSNLPVRTKFMIETITDLKNNRMKTGVAASAIVSEHTTRMKKQLGILNTRNLRGTEPLRIGLTDIRDTEKKGKWWLVGVSWRSNMVGEARDRNIEEEGDEPVNIGQTEGDSQVDLLQLAREQRMNTDVRRAIFVTIMSASDYKEAHVRLLKLNLKKSQGMEIPRVIIHCAGCEDTYNPYYTILARRFCTDHRSRKCFQFALWDVFKSLGEKKDDNEGSDDEEGLQTDMTLRRIVNLGKLYGSLIAKGDLSITTLKTLNFPYLKPKTKTLIEVLLVTAILESQKGHKDKRNERAVLNVFVSTDSAPEMIGGLQYYLKKVVSRTEITANSKEKATVKWAVKLIMGMLERLMATAAVEHD